MIMLWNGIWCRTKCCHSNNFQHPALTISHPQILTTEGRTLCLQSKWELWDCNPTWLKQELWHLTSVVLIRELVRPLLGWVMAPTALPKDIVWAGLLLRQCQQFSAASQKICPPGARHGEGELCWVLPHRSAHCEHLRSLLWTHA